MRLLDADGVELAGKHAVGRQRSRQSPVTPGGRAAHLREPGELGLASDRVDCHGG
jgi:hypothetical protein